MEKTVGIIGAGISGLLACKYTLVTGLNPIVFEVKDKVGGVWNQTMKSTKLQTHKLEYQFTDFPWSSSVEESYPHNTLVREYVQSYAQHFQLLPYIRFQSRVTGISYVGESLEEMESWEQWGGTGKAFGSKGKWHLTVQDTKEGCAEDYMVDFIILSIGRFSGVPYIPEFPEGLGPEVFSGQVLHSMDYSALDNAELAKLIKGKKVTVIGSAKSAMDAAAECAEANGTDNPCTVIQRNIHWTLPNENDGVDIDILWVNRFAELMHHKPGEGFLYSALATILSPLMGLVKVHRILLQMETSLEEVQNDTKIGFFEDLAGCGIIALPENFYRKVSEGSIVLKQCQKFSFCREGLMLERDSEPLKTDVVILATGYKGDEKLKGMFTCPVYQKYIFGSQDFVLPLYRKMIHPRIPQLAVIGYAEGQSDLFTSEICCQWLAHFLDDKIQLPSIREMEKDIKMWDEYMKQYTGKKYRRSCLAGIQIWYNDQICRDIGCDAMRKKGLLSMLFEAYRPSDYIGLTPDRKH